MDGNTDRVAALETACNSVGAKLISLDITRGQYDFCIIIEADSFAKVAAMTLKSRAAGAVGEVVTLEAVDVEEIRSAAVAVQYTPPSG